jgi:hypothetical protein
MLTSYPQWGRLPIGQAMVGWPSVPSIGKGALVLMFDRPDNDNQLTQLIPQFGPDAIYAQPGGQLLRPNDGTLLSKRIKDAVERSKDIVVLAYRDRDTEYRVAMLSGLNLCLSGSPSEFKSPLSGEIIVLSAARVCSG